MSFSAALMERREGTTEEGFYLLANDLTQGKCCAVWTWGHGRYGFRCGLYIHCPRGPSFLFLIFFLALLSSNSPVKGP